jgi:hypothetical protein
VKAFAVLALLLARLVAPAHGADFPAGSLPIAVSPGVLDRDAILTVTGHAGKGTATVVLRVDDAQSKDYASRVNLERTLPEGPFQWEIPLRGLKTSGGRLLDLGRVESLRLFQAGGDAKVVATAFRAVAPRPLPPGTLALSFGAEDAPVFEGFTRIAPGHAMIAGGKPAAIRRPGPDPLTASGIAGIEKLVLPDVRGTVSLSLFAEDPGEWETLPHFVERRIRVNGVDILLERHSPDQWLRDRYLRGRLHEHHAGDDAWSAFGRWRAPPITVQADAGENGLTIEFAGDTAAATFVNALLVEPSGAASALQEVQKRRAEWYRLHWPVSPRRESGATHHIGRAPYATLAGEAAPGTGVRLSFALETDASIEQPEIRLDAPARNGHPLQARIFAAQQRLERVHAAGTQLALDGAYLHADAAALPLRAGMPRSYAVWVSVPEDAEPGRYTGAATIAGASIPIEIDVLPVRLPPPKPAGFYLEAAPYWTWFFGALKGRDEQMRCDMAVLAGFGITGNAPAFADATAGLPALLADARRAQEAGMAAPWLAYTPAKQLFAAHGYGRAATVIAEIERGFADAKLPRPVWSIADEPSNAGHAEADAARFADMLRKGVPEIRLGGHLNAPQDEAIKHLFDVILINEGYGIDLRAVARDAAEREVWLYNTGRPRLTAGLWLWASAARRYLQWHARMPAADPFDPLDGREADFHMILPAADPCPATPAIHRDVLAMAEGLADQRWLAWLSLQTTAEARRLEASIRQRLGVRFSTARQLDDASLQAIRSEITALVTRVGG